MYTNDVNPLLQLYNCSRTSTNSSATSAIGYGTVEVRGKGDGSLEMTLMLAGLEPNSVGAMHIDSSEQCSSSADLVGTFYSEKVFNADPWQSTQWLSTASGEYADTFSRFVGFTQGDVAGRTFVIYTPSGTALGCGVFEEVVEEFETSTVWGEFLGTFYSGTGYTQVLPVDTTEAVAVIDDLIARRWLDHQTRLVTFEFNVYERDDSHPPPSFYETPGH